MVTGYRTYIIAVLIALAAGAKYLGYIEQSVFETLLVLLGAGGLATTRAAVANVDKKLLILLPLLLLFPTSSFAQSTNTLEWTYSNSTLTEVQGYTQSVTINGTAVTTPPTCVTQGSSVVCTVTIPALASGSNTVAVSATRGGMTAETRITGIDPNTAPKNPNSPKAKIVITINIGG